MAVQPAHAIACILLSLVAVSLQQEGYTVEDYNQELCGLSLEINEENFICDPDGLLETAELNQLNLLIRDIRGLHGDADACPCSYKSCLADPAGYTIGVALMDKIAETDDWEDDGDKPIEEVINHNLAKAYVFAYYLEQNWGLGNCEEDIIIVFSKFDSALYTMTGSTARAKLQDDLVIRVTGEVQDKFEKGKVFEGLRDMIVKYGTILKN